LVALAEHLIGKGLSLLIYDPEVQLSNLLGANRRFIEQHVPHIASLMRADISEVITQSDMIVVGLKDARFIQGLEQHLGEDHLVIDLANIPNREQIRGRVLGLCW
jgi:GDP-mannose 6-dehydrogenase